MRKSSIATIVDAQQVIGFDGRWSGLPVQMDVATNVKSAAQSQILILSSPLRERIRSCCLPQETPLHAVLGHIAEFS